MNRNSKTASNFKAIETEIIENFFEPKPEIFAILNTREKNFIRDNIFTFECFFATDPETAIRSFLFLNEKNMTEEQFLWNQEIVTILDTFSKILELHFSQNFSNILPKECEEFLENFYEKILLLTGEKPSNSMKYRSQMRKVVEKFFAENNF